jgi:hypothetical protein
MEQRPDGMVQSIIDRNREEAKRDEDKAAAIGAVIAVVAFEVAVGVGIVHFPQARGINLYRVGGAAVCGAVGAVIGKWVGRPRSRH